MNKKKMLSVMTHARREKKNALSKITSAIATHVFSLPPVGAGGIAGGSSVPVPPGVLLLPVAPIYYTTGVVIFDVQGQRWGEIVDHIPVGDFTTKTDIQLNALLTRTDDSTFELPTRAQYVIDVWFDNLKAEPDNHYVVIGDSTISTTTPQASDIVVTAFYLNKLEFV